MESRMTKNMCGIDDGATLSGSGRLFDAVPRALPSATMLQPFELFGILSGFWNPFGILGNLFGYRTSALNSELFSGYRTLALNSELLLCVRNFSSEFSALAPHTELWL